MDDLERLKELAGKATPGPWICRQQIYGFHMYTYIICGDNEHASPYYATDCHTDEPEAILQDGSCAAYIAAANPETVLKLIARVRELEANQRTPGTVEVCRLCRAQDFAYGHCGYSMDAELKHPHGCPLRSVSPSP